MFGPGKYDDLCTAARGHVVRLWETVQDQT